MRGEAHEDGLRETQVSRSVLVVAVIGAVLSVVIAIWNLSSIRNEVDFRSPGHGDASTSARPSAETSPRLVRPPSRDGLAEPLVEPDGGWPDALRSVANMVDVPAGLLRRGSLESGGEDDETPAHEVLVPAFSIDRYEVTNEEYAQCVAARVCRSPDEMDPGLFGAPRQPVVGVSWFDAAIYCRWSGKRLPTEAEWERAARGDDRRSMPWGDDSPTCERAVFIECDRTAPAEVGGRPAGASPYGAQDLAGNVWEWVEDWYTPHYLPPGPSGEIDVPLTGLQRVLRGGSWHFGADYIRTSNRHRDEPGHRTPWYGFRCAYSAPDQEIDTSPGSGQGQRDAGPLRGGASSQRRPASDLDAALRSEPTDPFESPVSD
jgi:formylglycine-generating enzyme required for sulfatase activity